MDMLFFNTLEQFGQKTALVTESGEPLSYQQLVADADSVSSIIGKRELVFCVCSNNIESVVGYVGFLRNRIVPILINPDIDKELYSSLENTYQPAYVWAPGNFVEGE